MAAFFVRHAARDVRHAARAVLHCGCGRGRGDGRPAAGGRPCGRDGAPAAAGAWPEPGRWPVPSGWGGQKGPATAADRSPVVGPHPDEPLLFCFVGQGGYGIQTAPALAQVAAELFRTGTVSDTALGAAIDPRRTEILLER